MRCRYLPGSGTAAPGFRFGAAALWVWLNIDEKCGVVKRLEREVRVSGKFGFDMGIGIASASDFDDRVALSGPVSIAVRKPDVAMPPAP